MLMEIGMLAPIAGVVGLGIALLTYMSLLKLSTGTDKMRVIGEEIHLGAMSFLKAEYKLLSIFVAVVAGLLFWRFGGPTAVAFISGAVVSGLAGFIGMKAATKTNVRTAAAAKESGQGKALLTAFNGGAVMGLSVASLGLIGLGVFYHLFGQYVDTVGVISGFSMGASSIALFARVGGGIFTKAADVGSDLVGKVEAGIPEDDPRNPGVIADNVGDNVGDVAGMGSDLLESYVSSIIGAATMAALVFQADQRMNGILFVLVVAFAGVLSSIIGSFFVKGKEGRSPFKSLKTGTYVSGLLFIVFTLVANLLFLDTFKSDLYIDMNNVHMNIREIAFGIAPFFSIIVGLAVGILIGLVSEYYTAAEYKHVKSIAKQSETGHATNIIAGISTGMESSLIPVLILATGIISSYYLAGLLGVGLAAVGMLSTAGITVSVDAYGPIADNAGGIAEMSGLDKSVRAITDKLDSVGNTTAAIEKGFAIGSAAMTSIALFSAFIRKAGLTGIDIATPQVMSGLIVGAMLAFFFSSIVIKSVGKAANKMIEEVRRQFREMPGILEYKVKPDYAQCVSIATNAALKQMVLPAILAIATPLVIGYVFGAEVLGGMLAGTLATGIMLAIFMANAGGAWDNAKKLIETGEHGGKGSEAHKAAVTGDTVGDPFKDTAGPSIDILIKLMTTISLVFAAAFGMGIL